MPKFLAALAGAVLAVSSAAGASPPGDPAPVIAAERAFAAAAGEVGITPAFLRFMTDDAIVFQPDTVNARAVWSARPPGKAPKDGGTLLYWWPNFAGIARSGDLGFTTGPASVNGKPSLFYFTVWVRQADGGWKWIYDGGVGASAEGAPGPEAPVTTLSPGDPKPLAPAKALAAVQAAEARIAQAARTDSAKALRAALAPDARIQGSALPPATIPAAVDKELATRSPAIAYAALGGGASKAGDLVWTYGDASWDQGRGHYVRIWQRRAGAWLIVFDQIVPV